MTDPVEPAANVSAERERRCLQEGISPSRRELAQSTSSRGAYDTDQCSGLQRRGNCTLTARSRRYVFAKHGVRSWIKPLKSETD